jgi:hypothetical protein
VIETFGVTERSGDIGGLYGLQKDLVQVASGTFEGDTGFSDRKRLMTTLEQYLDQRLPDGLPGLLSSLSQGDISAILNAQQEINRLIGSWSGVVAFGTLQIQHIGSGRGVLLKPGDTTPYPFLIAVTNRTDLRVIANVSASLLAPSTTSGSWPVPQLPIFDSADPNKPTTGPVITSLPLNSGETHMISLSISIPADAPLNTAVQVRVTAALPPPTSTSFSGDLVGLQTSPQTGPPVSNNLTVTGFPDPGAAQAQPATLFIFSFISQYVPTTAQPTISCTLTATFSASGGPLTDWSFKFTSLTPQSATANTLVAPPFPLSAGVKQTTNISITSPAQRPTTGAKVLSIAVTVQYLDPSGNPVTATATPSGAQPLTVTLKP